MLELEIKVARARELVRALQGLHAYAKIAKGQDGKEAGIVLQPFALSGITRPVLNENIAALQAVLRPFDEAVEVERKAFKERLDAELARIDEEGGDDDSLKVQKEQAEEALDRELNAKIEPWAEEKRLVKLQTLQRKQLNEVANPFDPSAFAVLLNAGIIVGEREAPKPAAAKPN